jgi:hypothetical protein
LTDYAIRRDYWDRPWVALKEEPLKYVDGRKSPVNAEAYTRISKLAGMLDDSQGLIDWVAAHAMLGLVKDEGLQARVTHLALAHKRPWYSDGKKPLKELVGRAKDKGGRVMPPTWAQPSTGCARGATGGMPPILCRGVCSRGLRPETKRSKISSLSSSNRLSSTIELRAAGNPDRYLRHKPTGHRVRRRR